MIYKLLASTVILIQCDAIPRQQPIHSVVIQASSGPHRPKHFMGLSYYAWAKEVESVMRNRL